MDALAKIKAEMLPFAELMGIEFTHAGPERVGTSVSAQPMARANALVGDELVTVVVALSGDSVAEARSQSDISEDTRHTIVNGLRRQQEPSSSKQATRPAW